MSEYIFGRNSVIEYLNSEKEVDKIFVQKGELKGSIKKILAMARDRKIVVSYADKKKLDLLAEGKAHQGVVMLTTDFFYSTLDDLIQYAEEKKKENKLDPLIIVLDEINDPHNLGAIVRTAECAGASGILIPKRRSASVTDVVNKSSAGALNYMKIARVSNITSSLETLKKNGYWVYGASGDAKESYRDVNYDGKVCLVIGNEGKGISRLVKENCDYLVKIPMYGNIESLNASTSAAILIYEIIKKNA